MKAHPERMFIFRLARELGMTVSRLKAEADSRELGEWAAYFLAEKTSADDEKKKKVASGLKAALTGANIGKGKSKS